MSEKRLIAFKIMLIYIAFGTAWILFSDKLMSLISADKNTIILISVIKGFSYVFLTGIVIYILICSSLKRLKHAELRLFENNHEMKHIYDKLIELEDFNMLTIQKMFNVFALHRIILDEKGVPCDYEYIDVNPAFEVFTGIKKADIIGKHYREIILKDTTETIDWVALYGDVALTGKTITF